MAQLRGGGGGMLGAGPSSSPREEGGLPWGHPGCAASLILRLADHHKGVRLVGRPQPFVEGVLDAWRLNAVGVRPYIHHGPPRLRRH